MRFLGQGTDVFLYLDEILDGPFLLLTANPETVAKNGSKVVVST